MTRHTASDTIGSALKLIGACDLQSYLLPASTEMMGLELPVGLWSTHRSNIRFRVSEAIDAVTARHARLLRFIAGAAR